MAAHDGRHMTEQAQRSDAEAGDQHAGRTGRRDGYDPQAIQQRWLPVWQQHDLFRAGARTGPSGEKLPKKYILDMFPYPSGDLHMGHAEAFAIGDVVARYWTLRGFDVLHPIGWDAFGLPAENAAIKRGQHPAEWTYANIATQAQSFERYGLSFDWSRRLNTCDPEYYRWTQWLFTRFLERGLAYRRKVGRQLVPGRPDGARQRAGRRRQVRAVPRRGHQA
jgi:leucyl-tRNA synthetase